MRILANSLIACLVLAGAMLSASTANARATGIPLDSDYLIFVIDTSGSMRRYEWDRVRAHLEATLDEHPAVAGIQVLNDEGNHLFLSTTGGWMTDSPQTRREILERLEDWDSFSNSSPRRGILTAIQDYADPAKRISVYVYSDDLSSGATSIAPILREIEGLNSLGNGGFRVRINGVAFPIYYDQTGGMGTAGDYVRLMNTLTQRNGGGFVALPSRGSVDGQPGAAREPMTGLPMDAERSLILLDASDAMAGAKWDRAVALVDSLTAAMPAGSAYQLILFGDQASPVVGASLNDWLPAGDEAQRSAVLGSLLATRPSGAASLAAAMSVISGMLPNADNVVLLTGGLPTMGEIPSDAAAADEGRRLQYFEQAMRAAGRDTPINVVLFDADPESRSAPAYWTLALATGGALLAPSEDWQ
jgi:hypothetical protein